MRIVLLGAPGSGKRTQAKKLMGKYAIPEVCTGEILRKAVADGAPLGRDARAYMDRGELVPDSIVLGLVHERLRKGDCGRGYIIDGFPRNEAQAAGLEKMLAAIGAPVTTAVSIEVDTEELMRRMLGRRICSMCGQVYNIFFLPPKKEGTCDICGGDFFRRDDDQDDTVRKRLDVYGSQRDQLTAYYRQKGILKTISGTGSADDIFRRICDALGRT
jgi:adenylate kinase